MDNTNNMNGEVHRDSNVDMSSVDDRGPLVCALFKHIDIYYNQNNDLTKENIQNAVQKFNELFK